MPIPIRFWLATTAAEARAKDAWGHDLWVARDATPVEVRGVRCLWIWPTGYPQHGRWVPDENIEFDI